MQKVALGLLWQDGDERIPERAREYSEVVPRVYVVDLRDRGEAYGSLAEPRLHYAPFRQRTSLGCALNRALNLAHEEGIGWLWIVDASTDIPREQLQYWSQKATLTTSLYRPEDASKTLKLFRRPSCGLLVSVAVARSLGGWSPVLPTQLVFADFEERLQAQGGTVEKSLKVEQIRLGAALGPWEISQGVWAWIQRRFFTAELKSR
jgi:hypothetical protein